MNLKNRVFYLVIFLELGGLKYSTFSPVFKIKDWIIELI